MGTVVPYATEVTTDDHVVALAHLPLLPKAIHTESPEVSVLVIGYEYQCPSSFLYMSLDLDTTTQADKDSVLGQHLDGFHQLTNYGFVPFRDFCGIVGE